VGLRLNALQSRRRRVCPDASEDAENEEVEEELHVATTLRYMGIGRASETRVAETRRTSPTSHVQALGDRHRLERAR